MTTEIPIHHIKQNICATRTPYRDGKHAKAVKVYTVNNESCYLLIQGVPSVGATQELNKLCGSFGQIDDFNALDDYPSQEKYTEVYLVKYNRIQSARFAKRKLDDYSFFGGALHVCYAPEYESVNETREKLQDRRRTIAARIRKNEKDDYQATGYSSSNNGTSSLEASSSIIHNVQCNRISQDQVNQLVSSDRLQNNASEISFSAETKTQKDDVSHNLEQCSHPETFELPVPPKELPETFELPVPPKELPETFELPVPPKEFVNSQHKQASRNFKRPFHFLKTSPTPATSNLTPVATLNLSKQPTASVGCADEINFDKNGQILNVPSHPSKIIVRELKSVKPAPRFVPRQAMRNVAIKSPALSSSSVNCVDTLDSEIRKNAFCLGEPQGPADTPHREISSLQLSVNETIKAIRNKISMVINKETSK